MLGFYIPLSLINFLVWALNYKCNARTIENQEKLQYAVSQDGQHQLQARGQESGTLSRRVSRVESLRRLILGASQIDSRKLFDRKKHRYTVDKSIGKLN